MALSFSSNVTAQSQRRMRKPSQALVGTRGRIYYVQSNERLQTSRPDKDQHDLGVSVEFVQVMLTGD